MVYLKGIECIDQNFENSTAVAILKVVRDKCGSNSIIEQLKAQLKVSNSQIATLTVEISNVKENSTKIISQLEDEVEESKTETEKLKAENSKLSEDLNDLKLPISVREAQNLDKMSKLELKAINAEFLYNQSIDKTEHFKTELANCKTEKQELKDEKAELKKDVQDERKNCRSDREELKKEKYEIKQENKNMTIENKILIVEKVETSKENSKLSCQVQIDSIKENYVALESKLGHILKDKKEKLFESITTEHS